MRFIILAALIFSGCGLKNWDKTDTGLLITTELLTFIDYRQTREIAKNPRYYEKYNFFLGKDPCPSEVDKYFLCSSLIKAGIGMALQKNKDSWLGILGRESWFMLNIGISTHMVTRNFRLGISVNF